MLVTVDAMAVPVLWAGPGPGAAAGHWQCNNLNFKLPVNVTASEVARYLRLELELESRESWHTKLIKLEEYYYASHRFKSSRRLERNRITLRSDAGVSKG